MPPKGKKAAAADKQKDVQETEDPLQAVVLADSFETRFRPFTLEKPRCLLPLANTPLIEYTLEFLANAGIDEVYVYCGAHTEQVEEYINASKWILPSAPFRLELIRSTSHSIGDAMRDLDNRGIMSNDFVVVYGDVVSNLPLDEVLAAHRERRAKDKNVIMTMVLRQAGANHRTKAQGTSPVFVIDPAKDRCLHYEQMSRGQENHYVELNDDALAAPEIDVRNDLIDCGIDICTPDVLALWSDNFDYEAPRKGFLHSVLKDYELNGKTIHTYITDKHYGARVRNLHAYNAISKDVISRWAYPFAPDSNFFDGQNYQLGRNCLYQEEDVKLHRSCKLGKRSVIGKQTLVGAGSSVTSSVIGRNVRIGKDCKIENAYIWDNVTIADGVEVRDAIIGSGSSVGSLCKILEGSLVTFDVRVPDNVTLKGGRRLVRRRLKSKDLTPAKGPEDAEDFSASESEEEDTRAGLRGTLYSQPGETASLESISTIHSDFDDEEAVQPRHTASGSFVSIASDDAGSESGEHFVHDAAASVYDSLKKGHEVSTIQLELQGLRMSANASEHQVRRAVVSGLIRHLLEVTKPLDDSRKKTLAVFNVVRSNKMIIERTMFDKGDEHEDKADQVDFLLLAQTDLSKKPEGDVLLHDLCGQGYNLDIFEPEGIEQWWNDKRSEATDELKAVRSKTHAVIVTLAEMDSESDDEDDDEDDDDDDDDDE